MKTCLTLPSVLALALVVTIAQAQSPAPAASAPPPTLRPAPKLQTAAQKRDSATAPGDLRPETRVVPQLNLPLGRTPPPPAPSASGAGKRARARSNGGIDDAAARCLAEKTPQERADCRAAVRRSRPAK